MLKYFFLALAVIAAAFAAPAPAPAPGPAPQLLYSGGYTYPTYAATYSAGYVPTAYSYSSPYLTSGYGLTYV